jgi:hypothetical protein
MPTSLMPTNIGPSLRHNNIADPTALTKGGMARRLGMGEITGLVPWRVRKVLEHHPIRWNHLIG